MKKKLATWLHRLASKICPSVVHTFDEEVLYEPKVCGKAYSIGKKEIKTFKKSSKFSEPSTREAIRELTKDALAKAKKDVFSTIESKIMEQRIYKNGNDTVVEVKVNCYVAKKKG